jgi:1-acyl-sn-glycerol-3-phosphate acyltransferase
VYFFILFFASLAVLYPLFAYLLADEKRWPRAFYWMQKWGTFLRYASGILIRYKTKEHFPKPPYVVVSNHGSYIDTVLMYCIIPDYFVFMGKGELRNWPLFNIFFMKGMNILVDRNNLRASHRAYQKAHEELSKKRSVAIFPEGGIPPLAPQLARFKNGAFRLAIEHEVPIVPITLVNSWSAFNSNDLYTGEGSPDIIRVVVHKPISTKGLTDKDLVHLRQQAFEAINKPLLENESRR